MKRTIKTAVFRSAALGSILFVAACGGGEALYEWDKYSYELKSYYKNPDEHNKFTDELYQDIQVAEEKGKVPPGLYAEYGYMLLGQNNVSGAISYFRKERNRWPESAYLMDKVISRLEGHQNY